MWHKRVSKSAWFVLLVALVCLVSVSASIVGADGNTFTVNSLNDPGDGVCDAAECTLREAVALAGDGDVINFAPGLEGEIVLQEGALALQKSVVIQGPGSDELAINGNGGSIFSVWPETLDENPAPEVIGLTLRGARRVATVQSYSFLGLIRCVVTQNKEDGYHLFRLDDSSLGLAETTVTDNQAGEAIFFIDFGSISVRNSTISNNSGTLIFGDDLTYAFVNNSTISGNSGLGSAIDIGEGVVEISHSTITDNENGGISIGMSSNPSYIRNSIIANQRSGPDCALYDVPWVSLGNNVDSDGTCIDPNVPGDMTVADAGLRPLADNGGLTQTHALTPDSPAVDNADCLDVHDNPITRDQRGVERPQGSACDSGSFELEVEPILLLSTNTRGHIGNLYYRDEDIIGYNLARDEWFLFFDGGDVNFYPDVNAFALLEDGSLLLSPNHRTLIPGVGWVNDADIVRFVPTSLGKNTAGTFELYFDGSDVGLTQRGEDIDALGFAPDGRLLISTMGNYSVKRLQGDDKDLLAFQAKRLGADTAGTFSRYFDGSDVGLTARMEDVWGAWVDSATEEVYLTTLGAFQVPGVRGKGNDIFVCQPGTLGNNTSCTYRLFWNGDSHGLFGKRVDGFVLTDNRHVTVSGGSNGPNAAHLDDWQNDAWFDDVLNETFVPFLGQ